jgi:hypothetical protein
LTIFANKARRAGAAVYGGAASLMDRMPLFKDLKPRERFMIALILFIDVAVLGFGCLLAAGKMM